MALPAILTGLLRSAAYPHACGQIRLLETHISWVILTGDFAYKVKKPERLPFLDFSTLERRRHFCDEELRCNSRFAPELYLGVVPILCADDGEVRVGIDARATTALAAPAESEPVRIVEWAVRMRQFPSGQELDHLVTGGMVETGTLRAFGGRLAALHDALPRRSDAGGDVARSVLAPIEQNFATLAGLDPDPGEVAQLAAIRRGTEQLFAALGGRFRERLAGGWVRECHGDLHLGNLVLLEGRVIAFDCLEFDPNLRWIDTQSDLAFLFMDCMVRGRADLAYACLDGYLDACGDYAGVALLPFYAVYRAMVRAKVAGIQRAQHRAAGDRAAAAAASDRLHRYLAWAAGWLVRPPGSVLLMCGVSGSGKSWLAERLVGPLGALRLRSDVARRGLTDPAAARVAAPAGAGGGPPAATGSGHVDAGRYSAERVGAVYGRLLECLDVLVPQGETVILDATFIRRADRRRVLDRAAQAGWRVLILHCVAPRSVLEARIQQRLIQGQDASEADLAVLERQLARQETPGPDEPLLELDLSGPLDAEGIRAICAAVAARLLK